MLPKANVMRQKLHVYIIIMNLTAMNKHDRISKSADT